MTLFINWYQSIRSYQPSLFPVITWAALDMIEAAVYRAATVPANVVNGQLQASGVLFSLNGEELTTPFGRVAFDSNGVNSAAKALMSQKLPSSSTSEIVYPSDIQTASFVYPMPTWDERVYTWSLVGGDQKKVSVIVAAICSAILVVIMATVFVHRKGELNKPNRSFIKL